MIRQVLLIHPSAWNRNSRKFALPNFSSRRLRPYPPRRSCTCRSADRH
jgi:hypothetical protein